MSKDNSLKYITGIEGALPDRFQDQFVRYFGKDALQSFEAFTGGLSDPFGLKTKAFNKEIDPLITNAITNLDCRLLD